MKVVIFGSTGNIGLFCVKAALKAGMKVRAFVRNEMNMPEDLRSQVELVQGDVQNASDVQKAVDGQEAVVVALGTRNDLSPSTVMSSGLNNIMTAMKESNVDVISVCLSSFLFFKPTDVPAIFKDITNDHRRMFEDLKGSAFKWIAVLPGHFIDDAKGHIVLKYDASPGRCVAKEHLGSFLVECLSKPDHYNQVVGVATVST